MKKSTTFVEENCLCERAQCLWVSAAEEMRGKLFILCQIDLKALNLTKEGINFNLVAINGFNYRLLVVIENWDRHFKLFQAMRIIW